MRLISCCLILLVGSPYLAIAAERQSLRVTHGFSYQHAEVAEKPWSIHIAKVDLAARDIEVHTTLGNGTEFSRTTLSQQIRTIPPEVGRPMAGINGDYYRTRYPYVGDPKGLQIVRGELVSGPCEWTCFWMDTSGIPHMTNVISRFEVTWPNGQKTRIGLNEEKAAGAVVLYTSAIGASTGVSGGRELVLERNGTNDWLPLRPGQTYSARVREVRDTGATPLNRDTLVLSLGRQVLNHVPAVSPGAIIKISLATSPDLSGVQTAIGGGPPLVRSGKMVDSGNETRVRHPRSAIGWNKTHFFLVEVDGRQRNLSVGMTYPELANYLVKLGCDEAMSLDGGGSATFWVYGQVISSPSEGRERGMGNALVVVQKEKKQ